MYESLEKTWKDKDCRLLCFKGVCGGGGGGGGGAGAQTKIEKSVLTYTSNTRILLWWM